MTNGIKASHSSDTMNADFGTVNQWYYPITSSWPYQFHNPNFYHLPEYTPPPTPPHIFHSPQPPPYYTPYTHPYIPDTNGIPSYSTNHHETQTHLNPNFPVTYQSYNVQTPHLSYFMSPPVTTTEFQPGFIFEQQPELIAPQMFDESPESQMSTSNAIDDNCHRMEDKYTEMIQILEKMGKILAESSKILKGISSKPVSQSSPMLNHISNVDYLDSVGILEKTLDVETEDSNDSQLPQLNISAPHMFDESPENEYVSTDKHLYITLSTEQVYFDVDSTIVENRKGDRRVFNGSSRRNLNEENMNMKLFTEDNDVFIGDKTKSEGVVNEGWKEFVDEKSDNCTFEYGDNETETQWEIADSSLGELNITEKGESNSGSLGLDGVFVVVDTIGFEKDEENGVEESESNRTLNDDIMLKDIQERGALKSEVFLGLSSFDKERVLDEGGEPRENGLVIRSLKDVVKDGYMHKKGEEHIFVVVADCREDIGIKLKKCLKVTNSFAVHKSVKEIFDCGVKAEIKGINIICDVRNTFGILIESDHEFLFGAFCLQLCFTHADDIYWPNVMRIVKGPKIQVTAYGLDKKFGVVGNKNAFIFDPGGGTFDIYSLAIEETISGFIITGVRMANHFLQERNRKNKKDITGNVSALRRVRTSEWKKCLKNTKLDKNYVHNVMQNGDSTMGSKVPQLLHEFLDGKKLFKSINFDETVVHVALAPATVLRGKGEENRQDLLLWDLIALSLNVETTGGVLIVLILRYTTISTMKEHVFSTYSNDYPGVSVQVFKDESTITENDQLLSKSKLSSIQPTPRDMTQIVVRVVVVGNDNLLSSRVLKKKLKEAESYKSEFKGMLMQLIFPGFGSVIVHVIWVAGKHIYNCFAVGSKFCQTLQILVARFQDMELLVHFDYVFALHMFGEGKIDLNAIQLMLRSLLDKDLGFSLRAGVPKLGEVMTPFTLKAGQYLAAMFRRCMDTNESGDEVHYQGLMAAGYRCKNLQVMVQMMLGAA